MADVSGEGMPEVSSVPPDGVAFMASRELLAMTNPFGGRDCVSIDLTREVEPSQLVDEIRAEVGFDVQVSICKIARGTVVSEQFPQRMYVSPPVPEEALREVITAHEIDPDYGLTEEQRERRDLIIRLREGRRMTDRERDRLLLLTLTESK